MDQANDVKLIYKMLFDYNYNQIYIYIYSPRIIIKIR